MDTHTTTRESYVTIPEGLTPEARTPGSVTTNTREPPAATTTSGSRVMAPTPKYTRLRNTISI